MIDCQDNYSSPLNTLCHIVRNNLLLIKYQRRFIAEAMVKEQELYMQVEQALADYVAAEKLEQG